MVPLPCCFSQVYDSCKAQLIFYFKTDFNHRIESNP
jgi:hypothetical protein